MSDRFEVVWSRHAVRDLDGILDYLADEAGVETALTLYENLRRRLGTLERYPRRCRIVPELREIGLDAYRELIYRPYRIFFRIDGAKLVLLGILDSRRDLEQLLVQRALALD